MGQCRRSRGLRSGSVASVAERRLDALQVSKIRVAHTDLRQLLPSGQEVLPQGLRFGQLTCGQQALQVLPRAASYP